VTGALVDGVKKDRSEVFVPRFVSHLTAFIRGLGLPELADFKTRLFQSEQVFRAHAQGPRPPLLGAGGSAGARPGVVQGSEELPPVHAFA